MHHSCGAIQPFYCIKQFCKDIKLKGKGNQFCQNKTNSPDHAKSTMVF